MFQKEPIFCYFWGMLYEKQMASLGGYPTHLDVTDISNLFYFHFVFTRSRLMTRLPRSNSASLAKRLCECLCTILN